VTFNYTLSLQEASASLFSVKISPSSQTVYLDDSNKNLIFTISASSTTQQTTVKVCNPPFGGCHDEISILNDDVSFEFIDDPTNPSPLSGIINPTSITYLSNVVGTTRLTIDTQNLPAGTYKFQVKAVDEDTNTQIGNGVLIKQLTLNPEPNPTQTHQRLLNLEENLQSINDTLAHIGPQNPSNELCNTDNQTELLGCILLHLH
jgi:hypothetical protein